MSGRESGWYPEKLTDQDIDQVLDLIRREYGDVNTTNLDYFLWQAKLNPYGDAVTWLAKSKTDQSLVGLYMVIPLQFDWHDRICQGSLSVNTLTRNDFRNTGIFTGLAEEVFAYCKENNMVMTIGFPNPNSYPGFVNKLDFHALGKLPLMLRILKPSNLIADHKSLAFPLVKAIDFFFNKKRKSAYTGEINELSAFGPDFDDFWENRKPPYGIMVSRTSRYMNWRYMQNPLRQYTVFTAREGGKIMGFIVGRAAEISGVSCGMVVDFMVSGENSFIMGKSLVEKLMFRFNEEGTVLAGCLMNSHTKEQNILKQSGFFQCPKRLEPQPFSVIYRNHADIQSKPGFNEWFLTMGDYDVI